MNITAEILNTLTHSSSANSTILENKIKKTSCYEKKYIFNPEPINESEPLVEVSDQKQVKLKFQKPKRLKFSSVEDEDGFIYD